MHNDEGGTSWISGTNTILYVEYNYEGNLVDLLDFNIYIGSGSGVPKAKQMVSIHRESFNVIFCSFLGSFKIAVLVLNVVPFLVLLIV